MTAARDLVVTNARLRGRDGLWSIAITNGKVSAIDRDVRDTRQSIDAGGGLVTESFVDCHLHLCKVYTLDRVGEGALTQYTARDMGGAMTAIELASAIKDSYEERWIYEGARRAILEGLRHGVTHVLAFADTDSKARLEAVKALLRLRDDMDGVVDIKVVAFPQDGLLRDEGAERHVREAVGMGADVVGGIPWVELTDADAREHVRRMVALAADHGSDVAMLVDDAGDASLRTTEMLATESLRLETRAIACHARAMSLYAEPYFRRLLQLIAKAGLSFVADPHTGPLHLRVFDLHDAGVPVALGQDDICDAYYPYGRHNMLEVAFLASHILEALDERSLDVLYDMVTTRAADVFGLDEHRLSPGRAANLVVLHADTVRAAFTTHAAPRYVIRSGRVVAENEDVSTLRL
ncbi:MAG TPA: amidohydrolase family protein [Actinomycetota bacterium]|nr:amidohydrolase family protein [Actinomycetota bacterium]